MSRTRDALKELMESIEQGDWISVEKRLPDDNESVLSWCPCHNEIHEETWTEIVEFSCRGVTHWMPLPLPPKSEEGGE